MASTGMTMDPHSPAYRLPAYEAMRQRWQFVRNIRGGTDAIRAMKEAYLPRFEAEDIQDYNTRVAMTFALEAVDETLLAMVGLALRNDPVLEDDVPPELVADWETFDGERTHGAVFAQRVLEYALQDGHAAILVDYPPVDPGLDLAQQRSMDIRPYAVLITIDQITAWQRGRVHGRDCLAMLKLQECVEEPDGLYGVREITRLRIYRQTVMDGEPTVTLEVQESVAGKAGAEYVVTRPEAPIKGPRWIPFFPVYGGKKVGILLSVPPFLGLAQSNLDHTQVKSDRRYSMHKCAIPIPIFINRVKAQGEGGKAVASPSYGIDIGIGGDARYMEPNGAALGALREELLDIQARMGSQGFDMLKREDVVNQTATAARIENTRGESKLARAVRSLEDALEGALQAFADFRGLKVSGGSVTLPQEFSDTIISPEEMRILMDLETRDELTLGTLLHEIQKGGRLLQGVDIEAELKAVEQMQATEPGPAEGVPPDAAAPAPAPAPGSGEAGNIPTPAPDMVLNGAQISAAKDIVIAVTKGELPRATGIEMLQAFFNISPSDAERIMGEAGTGVATTPNPNPSTASVGPAPVPA
jgi:hypothetical protein